MNLKQNEQGRSMVEMLGVLAIIGIISAGGLYSYSAAMKRYRANELLNEAMKRATILAIKLAADQNIDDGSLGEFAGTPYHENFMLTHDKTKKRFTLNISSVDRDICAQMQVIAGTDGIIRELTCDSDESSAEITFNDDLSSTEEENKEGECPKGSSTVGLGGSTGVFSDTKLCKCENVAEVYTSNGCEDISENCPSGTTKDGDYCVCSDHKTNQCGLGYYCNFYQLNGCTDADIQYAYCVEIDDTDVSSGEDGVMMSTSPMNWWSAYSFCKGLGLKMVTGRGSNSVQCSNPLAIGNSCTVEPVSPPEYYWLDTCTDNPDASCGINSCAAFMVDHGEINIYGPSAYGEDRVTSINEWIKYIRVGYAVCE